jgi:hypothetical protein
MTYYYPPPLPSSSPPYDTLSALIGALVDACVEANDAPGRTNADIEQVFEYAMALIEFWYAEFNDEGAIFWT